MFPKPKDIKSEPQAVHVYPDGREVCNMLTAAGKAEYNRRVGLMAARQGGVCCLMGWIDGCPGSLRGYRITFEHEDGRGMGGSRRDDRIEKDGRPYNGAAHLWCNNAKGSRRIPYNSVISPQKAQDGGS